LPVPQLGQEIIDSRIMAASSPMDEPEDHQGGAEG
jgi:hypothetical protein